jgi:hypothetical protein
MDKKDAVHFFFCFHTRFSSTMRIIQSFRENLVCLQLVLSFVGYFYLTEPLTQMNPDPQRCVNLCKTFIFEMLKWQLS